MSRCPGAAVVVSEAQLKRPPPRAPGPTWRQLREFAGTGGDATYLWPRWLVLRAVGLVYIFIFAGIVVEGRALVGPNGVAPVVTYLADIQKLLPGALASFFGAPSLFWLGAGAGMIAALAWTGLAAAIALVLNLWPRMALAICWGVFLSFVTTWADFSPAQLDGLMLETALLCIPFAPRGLRPGLGADSPPRPIALFMMRWMLFRVMFESGVVKLVSADPHWRDLTAMDVMYETAPSPTSFGYWVAHLPHAYHVFEIAFTFLAELVAPLTAVFGGRRGRWLALAIWTTLQAGIQLTCNFGWLNTAAIGLGLLLLDDQMLATAATKLGRRAWFGPPTAAPATGQRARQPAAWRLYGLRAALSMHFALTLFYFAKVCGVPGPTAPAVPSLPMRLVDEFRSANGYSLYANFESAHYQVDFEGSNDGGKTWRTYEYRHVPQSVDRLPAPIAPWFARFETTMQIASSKTDERPLLPLVAAHLLAQTPEVLNRFERDPFSDRPPTVVRMRRYRLTFTDLGTHRQTGRYWHKEFAGDFAPAMYVTDEGRIAQFDLKEADAALDAGNPSAALQIYTRQFQLGDLDAGTRIADIYMRGVGLPPQPQQAFALFSDLAGRGEPRAEHNLGLCYEYGVGVEIDYGKAAEQYRRAAEAGNLLSLLALGELAANDRLVPSNDVEGLTALLRAAARTDGDPNVLAHIGQEQPALAQRLTARMSAADVAEARRRASARH